MAPSPWTPTLIIFLIWHALDGLTHLLLESTYIYGCFAYSIQIPSAPSPPSSTFLKAFQPHSSCHPRPFLSDKGRLYGNAYALPQPTDSTAFTNALGALSYRLAQTWQEVALADHRYGGIDLTTLSLEIITVLLAGPLAIWVAWGTWRDVMSRTKSGMGGEKGGTLSAGTLFWATILAAGEIYGGIMNFLPEWLTDYTNLRTDDFVYFWFYIVASNMVWIVFPVWVLWYVYQEMVLAFDIAAGLKKEERQTKRSKNEHR